MQPVRFLRFKTGSKAILLGVSLIGSLSISDAATIYIGDSASQGQVLSVGTNVDTVTTVTYASVATSGMAQRYTATVTTTIQLTEFNFYRRAIPADTGAPVTGSVTPFVAIYTGDLTNASVNNGANYTVLSIGNSFSFGGGTTGLAAGVENLLFTGVNTVITLNAGQTLVAGFLNTGIAGLVTFVEGAGNTQNAIDYTPLSNALPGSTPNSLTANPSLTLNRTQKYNIGFVIIPEPSAFFLSLTGLGMLALRRRVR